MVSSSVYHFEDQLEQISAILKKYRYRVWVSSQGTMPVAPGEHNFDACRRAVRQCDVMLGIIRGYYGSGTQARSGLADEEISITHLEVREAIRLNKPRLFLVDQRVDTARQLLRPLRRHLATALYNGGREQIWDPAANPFRHNPVLDDLRILDMYEEALQSETPLPDRKSHWCQTYHSLPDIQRFLEAQFRDQNRLRSDLDTARASRPSG